MGCKVKAHLCECGESDPDNFYRGRKSVCKTCFKMRVKEEYDNFPLESKREFKDGKFQMSKKNIVRYRLIAARNRARYKGYEFELTEEGIVALLKKQEYKCHYSGIYLSDMSIDRVDSNKGYTYDNIVLTHKDVNYMKQDYGVEYFLWLVESIAKHQNRA